MNAKHASLAAWALVVAVGVGCSGKIETIPDGNPSSPSASGTSTGGPGASSSPSGTPSGSGTSPTPTASGTTTGTPGEACFDVQLGTLCSDPSGRAKDVARAMCEDSNAVLVALSTDSTGGCSARCCQNSTPPPPPPPLCVWTTISDPSGCIPNAQLGARAQAACEAVEGRIQSILVASACPGGASSAKVECCY